MKQSYLWLLVVVVFICHTGSSSGQTDSGLIAHEWGTFTSFQGGDGVLKPWRPNSFSLLPSFVYNWNRPGLGRQSTAVSGVFGKGSLTSLQRLETPVVYFYSDTEQTVDLTVKFPNGLITEWYPQADRVGPSIRIPLNTNLMYGIPNAEARAKELVEMTTLADKSVTAERMICWSNLHILPAKIYTHFAQSLRTNAMGSHYYAAREAESEFIRSDLAMQAAPLARADPSIFYSCSIAPDLVTHPGPEVEKFVFYRGAGNFATPLRVTMTSDDTITLANTGTKTLSDLFILGIENHVGNFVRMPELKPGEEKSIPLAFQKSSLTNEALTARISREMAEVLVRAGLYQREAQAMVHTWADSWFKEEGLRVLYLLPREWTDETLPMSLNPTPKESVRVMVGRSEILSPGIERELTEQLTGAREGGEKARAQLKLRLKSLGRFAAPAFARVLPRVTTNPAEQMQLNAILNEVEMTPSF